MIRRILVILMLTMFSGLCFAQTASFGIKGGVNLSNFIGEDAERNSTKTGFIGGAFFCFNFTTFCIQPEILYTQKGCVSDLIVTYNYVDIPVLVKIPLIRKYGVSPYLGPAVSLLANAKIADFDISQYVNSPDLGLVLGGEIKTPFKISLDVRYTMGLRKIFNDYNDDIKHSVFSIMLGLHP